MRVITWNMKRATKDRSVAWKYLSNFAPDIATLQEVSSIPAFIKNEYSILQRPARTKGGSFQKFNTSILVKGIINHPIEFSTRWNWVNEEIINFAGNIISTNVSLDSGENINVVSIYSPAWPIFPRSYLKEIDASEVKLMNNPDIWLTEIIWASLLNRNVKEESWIVAGDFNSSVTFDILWGDGPRGNQEFQDRMIDIGLVECLVKHQGTLTPTFKNPNNKKIIHQMDHLFVSKNMIGKLKKCTTGEQNVVFDKGLSDHLPIIADFK